MSLLNCTRHGSSVVACEKPMRQTLPSARAAFQPMGRDQRAAGDGGKRGRPGNVTTFHFFPP